MLALLKASVGLELSEYNLGETQKSLWQTMLCRISLPPFPLKKDEEDLIEKESRKIIRQAKFQPAPSFLFSWSALQTNNL